MGVLLTDLDIINAACAAYGDEPLQSLGEETSGGQAALLIYEDVVEFNLGIYLFSFAREIRQLSIVDGASPLSGYDHVFDLPAERLGAPIYVTDDVTDPDRRFDRFVLIGSTVHANANPLFAQIRIRPQVRDWSPAFKSATIAAVASKLAMARADAGTEAERLHVEAYGTPSEGYRGGKLGAAISADSFSTPPRRTAWGNNPLERARY
jgi:hypothetical protein